ncbi:formyltransferase family protein [Desulfovibrio sp. UCD-KL4C]|uniref:methionyl-tRNA formyltransferase n=1 Tax=Desulfovibrio sp. UCD-KL4C TaxID=2578120 RepID=UPI0025C4DD8C|nr:formyltransferase family protein [Desulfovibrio sp. UCD-KL4C]
MKIVILNTIFSGIDVLNSVASAITVDTVIGLSPLTNTANISGFVDQKEICENKGINYVEISDYSLRDASDQQKILNIEIDILLVAGWQRLIPEWLISHCSICAVGSHGSPYGITEGRGRSPQNWALILGKTSFNLSIFKITPGIDDGATIKDCTFEISQFDTIASTHHKVSQLTAQMFIDSIEDNSIINSHFTEQTGIPKYLPMRKPEDGEIDWFQSSLTIHNFIRALTEPYPGAFSLLGNEKIFFLQAYPYFLDYFSNENPGSIIKTFANGDFLVKTGDSFMLVTKYLSSNNCNKLIEGQSFESCKSQEQYNRIISRHISKYPELPIVEDILELGNLK